MISKNQLNEKGEWEQKYVTIKSKKTVTEDGIETFLKVWNFLYRKMVY